MLEILILLVYYDRPQIVRNALESVRDQGYSRWKLIFIDDGSLAPGESIGREILGNDPRVTYVRLSDTIEQKIIQGGSRHGAVLNDCIMESTADLVVILCDDDALYPEYLSHLDWFFSTHSEQRYGYCHVAYFDPIHERVKGIRRQSTTTLPAIPFRTHRLNRYIEPIDPAGILDSSQVVWRRQAWLDDGIRFPEIQTANLDYAIYQQMMAAWGPCPFMGGVGQWKGASENRLWCRLMGERNIFTHTEE